MLKLIGDCLIAPMSLLFESMFMYSYVPKDWKMSYITPLHKKGPASDPENYRPIAGTRIFCRTMECIINSQLINYLQTNKLLSTDQHRFLTGKSTVTNLFECTQTQTEQTQTVELA